MSFDDINKGAGNVVYMGKYDANLPDFEQLAAFKLFNWNFKAAPKDGITMSHQKLQQHSWKYNKDAKDYDSVEKSNSKLSMKQLDTNIDLQLANDKWSARFTRDIPAGDWDVSGRFFIENKPTKEWKYECAAEVQSPDLGGFNINANVSAELDKQKQDKGAWKQQDKSVDVDLCATIDKNYTVGAAATFDMANKSLGDYKVGAGCTVDENNFWLNYDVNEKQAKAGCQIKDKDVGFTHAYELKHYGAEKAEYFWGYPVAVAGGGKYVLSKQTGFAYAIELGKQIHLQAKFDHKVDKNWKVAVHQSYDMNKKDEKPYNLGFDVTYTL